MNPWILIVMSGLVLVLAAHAGGTRRELRDGKVAVPKVTPGSRAADVVNMLEMQLPRTLKILETTR